MDAEVRIERYADQGRCVAHIDGRVVFVRFALPGERALIRLDEPHERDDRFWTAETVRVLEASDDRVDPVWPLAGPLSSGGGVGGADLIHVSLEGQRRWKSMVIADQLRRMGHVDVENVPVSPSSDDGSDDVRRGLGWRTRIEMVADDEGRPSMRRRGTHIRVPLDSMPLASDAVNAVAEACRLWDGGFEPGARIRVAAPEPRTGAGLDSAVDDRNNYAVLVDGDLRAGSRVLIERVPVHADGDAVRWFEYRVDASGFWQMHRLAPPALADEVLGLVRRAVDGSRRAVIWDLYSGSGLFTLPLSVLGAPETRMLSVEGAAPAVRRARENLKRAGIDAVNARVGDVAKTLRHGVPKALAKPDVVVLDPPRAGAKRQVCEQIAASGAAHVVYVACDPTSLARDTATLTASGYELRYVRGIDIYPNTHHVETVAWFARRNG